jgi:hypothetical protein
MGDERHFVWSMHRRVWCFARIECRKLTDPKRLAVMSQSCCSTDPANALHHAVM